MQERTQTSSSHAQKELTDRRDARRSRKDNWCAHSELGSQQKATGDPTRPN